MYNFAHFLTVNPNRQAVSHTKVQKKQCGCVRSIPHVSTWKEKHRKIVDGLQCYFIISSTSSDRKNSNTSKRDVMIQILKEYFSFMGICHAIPILHICQLYEDLHCLFYIFQSSLDLQK